ncbi:MAG TPA: DoxX family protein [Methylomirabilota bacterium]|jgi:putative oxidoreductase
MIADRARRGADWGRFVLRAVLGLIFAVHGAQKVLVFGLEGTAGFMTKVGVPLPTVAAIVVMVVELVGGLALILGAGTRVAAALIAIDMVVAILLVTAGNGFVGGYEFELMLLAAAVSVALLGAGALSLDRAFWPREDDPDM